MSSLYPGDFVDNCRDLAVAEPKKNRSDPYVKCYLLPDKTKMGKRKTSVKKKTQNPAYKEVLTFKATMEVLKTQKLNISVWHDYTLRRNSFLGEVELELSEWDFSNTQIKEYALKPRFSAPASPSHTLSVDKRGEMRVALRFLPQISLREACIEITVWDHDRLNNHYIGGLRLGLGTGKSYGADVMWNDSTTEEANLWERMMKSHSEWVEDVLPLRMLVMAKSKIKPGGTL